MRLPIFLILCLGFGSALSAQETAADTPPRISVSGEGSAFATPDMATITLGVTARSETADAAMAETSETTAAILERLAGFDVAPRDTQTSDLSLNPIWSNRSTSEPGEAQKIEGFEASNRLTVRVRDIESLGDILGEVLADGANRLGGLSFGLQSPEPLVEEARRKAVDDAMARARTYAEAAGMTLGPVVSITEGGIRMPRPEMAMAAMRDAPVPVASGETGITASVSMVFELTE